MLCLVSVKIMRTRQGHPHLKHAVEYRPCCDGSLDWRRHVFVSGTDHPCFLSTSVLILSGSGVIISIFCLDVPTTNPLPHESHVVYCPYHSLSTSYSVPQCGHLMFICNLSFPRLPYRTPPLWRGKRKRRTHIVRNFQTKIENASSPH